MLKQGNKDQETAYGADSAKAQDPGPASRAAVKRRLFGTDGVRGVANQPPMTPEMALSLGRAITFVATRGTSRPLVNLFGVPV